MTTNPNRLKPWRRNDLQKIKSAKGVEARKRLRLERWQAWRDVGGLVTDGVLGKHCVRLLVSDSFGERLAVVVDWKHRQARTLRGVTACLAKMIFNVKMKGESRT